MSPPKHSHIRNLRGIVHTLHDPPANPPSKRSELGPVLASYFWHFGWDKNSLDFICAALNTATLESEFVSVMSVMSVPQLESQWYWQMYQQDKS